MSAITAAGHPSRPIKTGRLLATAVAWARTTLIDPVISLGFIMLAVFWASIAHHIWTCTAADLDAAIKHNSNLAIAFSQHVSQAVRGIDSTLMLSRTLLIKPGSDVRLRDIASAAFWRDDYVLQLAMTGPDGVLAQSNLGPPDNPINLSDRAHVSFHKSTIDDVLYVSEPVLGRVSNRWSIQFTRRIVADDPQGSGVLIASISPDYFSRFYQAVEMGRGSITLINANGRVLASGGSDAVDVPNAIHVAKDQLIEAAGSGKCFQSSASLEGSGKLYCARAVPGAPLFVVAAVPEGQIHADGVHENNVYLVALLVTFACLILMIAFAGKRIRLDIALRETERARQQASNSARELRYTLENMCHGIMLIDLDGRIPVFNDRAFDLLGLPLPGDGEQVTNDDLCRSLGQNAAELKFPELRTLQAAMRLDAEGVMHCAGRDGRIVKVWTEPVRDGWVRKFEDITQPFLAGKARASARDREQAASNARAAFVTRMSHEIRTPLHAAIGFSRLLTREDLPPQARALASEMHTSTSHLIEIIDEVLDFSTIEAGQMRLASGVIDIRSTVDTVVSTGKILLGYKPVAFNVKVDPRVPQTLAGDARRVRQVLTNLVSNAVKFTERGTISLAVTCMPGGEGVLIEVSDTGSGIEDTSCIFEPFVRTREADDKPGAGLGLTIVKEIVTAMNGRIKVTSQPGSGSIFQVFLALQAANASLPAPKPPVSTERLKILVADDTRSSLMLITMMLQARGHRVVTARNGREAVEANAEEDFDLILLDIQMPVMDGLVAAEVIINNAMRIGRRPLISALTAQVLPQDQAVMRKVGMDAVLRKPFEEAEFDAILHRAALRKEGMRREPSFA